MLFLLATATGAKAVPYGDSIPQAFHGEYSRSLKGCNDKDELAFLTVAADHLKYYEADEYLLLGISYSGSVGSSSGPMFNGRFTVRQEANLLGEVNLTLIMAEPNVLVRYTLKEDGEPDEANPDRWVRCPGIKQ